MNVVRIGRGLIAPRRHAPAAWAAWLCLLLIARPAEAGRPQCALRGPLGTPAAPSGPNSLGPGFLKPIDDVTLQPGGVLEGEVLYGGGDASSGEVAGLPVALLQGPHTAARTTTDAGGRFALRNLSGGLYRVVIETADGPQWRFCRLWTFGGAPPHAVSRVKMLIGRGLVRGQSPFPSGGFPRAAVVTAVAVGAIAPPIIYFSAKRDDRIPASP